MPPMVPMPFAAAIHMRSKAYVAAPHFPAGSWRVTRKPPTQVPVSRVRRDAMYWRPRPCGSISARTGSARSQAFIGLSPWWAFQASNSVTIWRRWGSSALTLSIRSTGSRQPRARSGSRHHSAQVSKLPSGRPERSSAVFWRPQRARWSGLPRAAELSDSRRAIGNQTRTASLGRGAGRKWPHYQGVLPRGEISNSPPSFECHSRSVNWSSAFQSASSTCLRILVFLRTLSNISAS